MARRKSTSGKARSKSENIMIVVGLLVALSMVIGGFAMFLQ